MNPTTYLGLEIDAWQVIGIFATCLISFVAIIISIATLIQNSKMIESTSRPYLSIYGNSANTSSPYLYFVIRNFGNSSAKITKLSYNFDFKGCFKLTTDKDYIKSLLGSTIAPGQSRICLLDYDKITEIVSFEIEYKSSTKTYVEKFDVNFRAGNDMVTPKTANKGRELETISYTLQDMLQKDL